MYILSEFVGCKSDPLRFWRKPGGDVTSVWNDGNVGIWALVCTTTCELEDVEDSKWIMSVPELERGGRPAWRVVPPS